MKIRIIVKPNSRREAVEKTGENEYRIRVNAPPAEGKANEAVIALLAKHFSVPKSSVQIVSGLTSKNKRVEILE